MLSRQKRGKLRQLRSNQLCDTRSVVISLSSIYVRIYLPWYICLSTFDQPIPLSIHIDALYVGKSKEKARPELTSPTSLSRERKRTTDSRR